MVSPLVGANLRPAYSRQRTREEGDRHAAYSDARGVFPIAPTPFDPDGSLDFASLDRLIDHYVAIGADGCTLLGILGEAPKLDAAEALAIVKRCVRGARQIPFIVGVSAPGSRRCGRWRATRWKRARRRR